MDEREKRLLDAAKKALGILSLHDLFSKDLNAAIAAYNAPESNIVVDPKGDPEIAALKKRVGELEAYKIRNITDIQILEAKYDNILERLKSLEAAPKPEPIVINYPPPRRVTFRRGGKIRLLEEKNHEGSRIYSGY